ncbi:MAG: ribokinase [Ilumatobacter sp.]|uniref:ribokinase n=1 Tax=Ilumatobacter sp. TaxID=1967498 RepID=UPI0039194682
MNTSDDDSTATFDVVVVGSLNLDLVATTARHPTPGETVLGAHFAEFPGGKGLNQAVAAARSGARVAIVGAVGDDDAGRTLRSVVRDEGIDDTYLRTIDESPTGRALITVDATGENSIVVIPGANAAVEVDADHLPRGRVTLLQLEIPIDTVVASAAIASLRESTIVLNPAPATTALPTELLAQCDVVIPNEHEIDLIGGAAQLLADGVATLIVTRGGAGSDLVTMTGHLTVPPFAVTPIDTTGAGDAFCGALSARLAEHADVMDAARYANAAGALATMTAGAVPSLPTRQAVEAFIAESVEPT